MNRKTVPVTGTDGFVSDALKLGKREMRFILVSLGWYIFATIWDVCFAVIYISEVDGPRGKDPMWLAYVMWVMFSSLTCVMVLCFMRDLRTYRKRRDRIKKISEGVA